MAYAARMTRLGAMRKRSLIESHAADARQRADELKSASSRVKRLHDRIERELRRKGGRGKLTIEVSSENRETLRVAMKAMDAQRAAWIHTEHAIRSKESS